MARKKLNAEILSFRDFTGEAVTGIYSEIRPLTNTSGEPLHSKSFGTPLNVVDVTDKTTGEIRTFWADGGLRGAFALGKVKPGMYLSVVHTGERTIETDDGKARVQTYDVYAEE